MPTQTGGERGRAPPPGWGLWSPLGHTGGTSVPRSGGGTGPIPTETVSRPGAPCSLQCPFLRLPSCPYTAPAVPAPLCTLPWPCPSCALRSPILRGRAPWACLGPEGWKGVLGRRNSLLGLGRSAICTGKAQVWTDRDTKVHGVLSQEAELDLERALGSKGSQREPLRFKFRSRSAQGRSGGPRSGVLVCTAWGWEWGEGPCVAQGPHTRAPKGGGALLSPPHPTVGSFWLPSGGGLVLPGPRT